MPQLLLVSIIWDNHFFHKFKADLILPKNLAGNDNLKKNFFIINI